MSLTLEQIEFLRTPAGRELLDMDLPDDPFHAVQALRKRATPDEAAAVATLRTLRRKAAASRRFPEAFAARMLGTDKLLQQASSFRLAVWMGRRLAGIARNVGAAEAIDLCCGLGSDAIGIARAGLSVRGVDVDPVAVFCAAHNARAAGVGERCAFETADAQAVDLPPGAVVHVDPDRRAGPGRSARLADASPGVGFLARLPAHTAAGAMKLSPALEFSEAAALPVAELEYVSEQGVCKQLLGWWGTGAPRGDRPRRRATVVTGPIEDPEAVSLAADVAPYVPVREPGEWLVEPDPAVIAAEAVDDLAAAAGLWRIQPGLPWLFGDKPAATPLARDFRVLASVPGREKDVARGLARLDAGTVEIKPRGIKLPTDKLQRTLRGRGRRRIAVLWCRLGSKQRAFLCERAV